MFSSITKMQVSLGVSAAANVTYQDLKKPMI